MPMNAWIMGWKACQCLAVKNGRTKHTNLSQKETLTSAESSPTHRQAWQCPFRLLPTSAHSRSLSLSLTYSLSTTDGFLWVQGRARLFHSNPQPHRRKSLLEHLLITTKSQTRARERSPGIRLCSNSKGLPNSPDKPLWNSTCSGCAMGSACLELKPSSKSSWNSFTQRSTHTHTDSQLHTPLTKQARLFWWLD